MSLFWSLLVENPWLRLHFLLDKMPWLCCILAAFSPFPPRSLPDSQKKPQLFPCRIALITITFCSHWVFLRQKKLYLSALPTTTSLPTYVDFLLNKELISFSWMVPHHHHLQRSQDAPKASTLGNRYWEVIVGAGWMRQCTFVFQTHQNILMQHAWMLGC